MMNNILLALFREFSPHFFAEKAVLPMRPFESGTGISFAWSFGVGLPLKTAILSWLFKSPAADDDVHGMNVVAFLQELVTVAPPAGGGHYGFKKPDGHSRGFVQLICSERIVRIHRIWASEPGTGDGSIMMRTLCELADRHGVEMKLKVIPIGRKPFPMSREKLKAWYQRFDFAGERWTLTRKPTIRQYSATASAASQSSC